MNKKIAALIAIVCLAVGASLAYAVLSTQITIPGEGKTATFPIDKVQLAYTPQKIDWGNNISYAPITRQVTITNTGNVYTKLHMSATFLGIPTDQVTWDCENVILAPNQSITANVTFSLAVGIDPGADITTELIITGTQVSAPP